MKKGLITILALILAVFVCGNAFATGGGEGVKVGLSFSDFETERWSVEADALTELFEAEGAEVIVQVANHDAKLQNDQIDNMVTQGCDVIIVVAEDGAAAATAVDAAAAEGVPVIAYDRLIKSANLACYISFDNVEVGRCQARGVLDVVDSGRFVLLGGSPTDNNAILFRKGQMEVLQPLIDSGQITIVADQWVESWTQANALVIMENILTATGNDIDAVVASNDGTALGALQAMEAQGLAGSVPISGQDATEAGCQSIIDGQLTMTVLKDLRNLAPLARDVALLLANGKRVPGLVTYSLAELTGDDIDGTVDCKFLEVISVNQDNLYEEVIVSGFQDYDVVYANVPASERPPRP
jgi:D-xylose transport system substrate-binding protein